MVLCGGFSTEVRAKKMRQDGAAEFISASLGTVRNGRRLILPPKGGDGMGIYDLYVFLILLITLILVIKS